MATQNISVPDIGTDDSVEVIEVCVAVGDAIEEEQSIVVLESDKASMDIPSPAAGIVKSITVKVGDKVAQGHALIELESSGASAQASSSEPVSAASESTAEPSSGGGTENMIVPVPEGAGDAQVIEFCVAVGDDVNEGDSLIVLESDKASMEVPSPASGKVVDFIIKQGDTSEEGSPILTLAVAGGSSESAAQSSAPAAPAVQSGGEQVVTVPEGAEDADVIELCVSVGDTVNEGDSLIVLETDKASMEVPSPASGKVVSFAIKVGDKTAKDVAILTLSVEGASATPAVAVKAAEPAKASPAASASKPSPASAAPAMNESAIIEASRSADVYAGPSVRKLAREMAIDLTRVKGTGDRSRITKDDVKGYVKQVMTGQQAAPGASGGVSGGSGIPAIPAVDFSQFGEIEMLKMSKIKKLTAEAMCRNWLNIPHVTQFDDVDITELEIFRKGLKAEAEKRGVKITPLPFLLKACAAALVAEPSFNVSMHSDGEHIVQKHYVNIGIAVDSPVGLVVPVLRDVDKKGIWEIAADFDKIIAKARDGKLGPKDMQGGCFTVSSLGAMGGTGFTPIVNAPEVAILGVSKAAMKPVWDGKEFLPRQMLPLALSYDHRAINGGDAGRFFVYLNSVLSDIRKLLL